ncbi:MAG: DUF3592 domain-containing protein [Campylobacteraceae bacterium]
MRVIGFVFLLITLGLCAATFHQYTTSKDFLDNGLRAVGTVEGYETRTSKDSDGKSSTYYHPVVSFTDKSGEIVLFTSSLGTGSRSYAINEKIEVLYHEANPENATINSFLSLWFSTIILGIFSVIFLIISFFIIKLSYKQKKNEINNEVKNIKNIKKIDNIDNAKTTNIFVDKDSDDPRRLMPK